MILEHYSTEPLLEVNDAHQLDYLARSKPSGLWISIKGEYDWPKFCHAEEFHTDRLAVRNVITLSEDANILYLKSSKEIDSFTRQYRDKNPKYNDAENQVDHIEWFDLADEYQGIIIAPYQWDRRLDMFASWYYSWDCASGCIWNGNAVGSIAYD